MNTQINPINEELLCQENGVRMNELELTNEYMYNDEMEYARMSVVVIETERKWPSCSLTRFSGV